MKTLLTVLILLAFGVVSPARANQPAIYVEYVHTANAQEVSLLVLPDGSGLSLSEAMLFGGTTLDATIEFRLITEFGEYVAGYPFEDIWLEDDQGALQGYTYSFMRADANTDANGVARFSRAGTGGGAAVGDIRVIVSGTPATPYGSGGTPHPPLPLRTNSPDINGDGKVDLVDVPLFAGDFYNAYDYRSDFVWDGQINLSDVVQLAAGLGHNCP